MSFQKTIQCEAQRQGLSGYRIGKLSGIPIRTVQEYLSGRSDLAGRRIEAIAAVLGLGLQRVRRVRKSG
jgi:transcriptional regulator with XRE-family HTH domain